MTKDTGIYQLQIPHEDDFSKKKIWIQHPLWNAHYIKTALLESKKWLEIQIFILCDFPISIHNINMCKQSYRHSYWVNTTLLHGMIHRVYGLVPRSLLSHERRGAYLDLGMEFGCMASCIRRENLLKRWFFTKNEYTPSWFEGMNVPYRPFFRIGSKPKNIKECVVMLNRSCKLK